MFLVLLECHNRIIDSLEAISRLRNHFIKASLILLILFTVIYFPEIIIKEYSGKFSTAELDIKAFLNQKIQNPLIPFTSASEADHLRKRDLRITPYVIGNLFHLNASELFYLQLLLFALFIYICLRVIQDLTSDGVTAILGTVCLLFCYVGNSFNFDTLFLDSYAYMGLLLAVFFRNSLACVLILLISYFVDERSLAPSLIIPLISYLKVGNNLGRPVRIFEMIGLMSVKNKSFWFVFAAVILYALARAFFYQFMELRTPVGQENGVDFGVAFSYGERVLPALWSALKSNLFLITLGIIYLHQQKNYVAELWVVSVMLLTLGIALSVEDVTRSFAYCFPVVFAIYQIMVKSEKKANIHLFMLSFSLINIFTPTYTLILDLIPIESFSWLF